MKFSASLRALAAATALFPAAALAQQTDDEPEIVVTAPLEGSRIESLQGAEVLRREDIIEQLNGGLGDTLDATPGISTTFFGAGASRPIIRGLGEDRVRVLQNGIGAIDASTASPDHAVTADGLDAERIEVLRGAAALAYGGNAIGGVVNVIDQSIPTRPIAGVTFSGLASHSSGDDGTQAAGNLGVGAGDLSVRVSAASRETDNYDTPIGEAPNSWTDLTTYAIGASLAQGWGFGGIAIKRTEDNYGLLPEGAGEPGGHIEMEQTRIETRGDIRIAIGPFDRLDWGAQSSDYEHTEFEGDGEPGTRFTSEGWEARLEAHHGGDQLQGAIGLQATDVDFAAEGEEAFISATNTRDLGVFAVERYDRGGWGVEGGARLERRQIDNETFGAREFDNVSASAGIFFRPAQNWFTGATIAHTERAPTAIELFSDGPHLATANYEVGDPDMGQEEALSIEGSVRYDSGPMRFEINLFRVGFEDYIALVERGDVFWIDEDTNTSGFAADEASAPAGADDILPVFNFVQQDATFTGGEISVTARLFEAAGFTFTGNAALDLVRADFGDGGHPPRIPPQAITLGLEAENPNWTGRVEMVDTAEQDRLAAFETPTDGYTFFNASLAFRPQGEDGPWTIRLDGRNLTDELGRVHSSFLKDELPLPGRNVRVTLTTEF